MKSSKYVFVTVRGAGYKLWFLGGEIRTPTTYTGELKICRMFEPYEKNRLGPVGPDLEQNKSKTKEDNSTQYKGTQSKIRYFLLL